VTTRWGCFACTVLGLAAAAPRGIAGRSQLQIQPFLRRHGVLHRKASLRCRAEGWERAHEILTDFDVGQRRASSGVEGLTKGTAANEFSKNWEDREALWLSVKKLADMSTSLVMGICAGSAEEGVGELKGLVSALGLKRNRLHGMDNDGVPRDMADFGAVYIRYVAATGDAYLSGYDGYYRGVYVTPQLKDGEFRQYGVLPLGLWREDSPAEEQPNDLRSAAQAFIESSMAERAAAMSVELKVTDACEATGTVHVSCKGSDDGIAQSVAVRRWIEASLAQMPVVKKVNVT